MVTKALRKPRMSFLRLQTSIQKQLQIEEALFRAESQRSWFIYNDKHAPATIVMGISGKPEQLLHLDAVKRCVELRAVLYSWVLVSQGKGTDEMMLFLR